MPRTIKADGRTITVPDDATDDEINQIVGPPAAQPSLNQRLTAPVSDEFSKAHPVLGAISNFGGGVINAAENVIAHPIESAKGTIQTLGDIGNVAMPEGGSPEEVAASRQRLHQQWEDFKSHPAYTAGGLVGGAEAGEGLGGVVGGVTRAVPKVVRGAANLIGDTGPKAAANLVAETADTNAAAAAKAGDADAAATAKRAQQLQPHFERTQAAQQANEAVVAQASRKAALQRGVETLDPIHKTDLTNLESTVRAEANRRYNELNANLDAEPAPAHLLGDLLSDASEEMKGSNTETPIMKDMERRMSTGDDLSYRDLQGYRSEIGRELQKGSLPSDVYHAYKGMQASITDAMSDIAKSRGLGDAFDAARDYYRKMSDTFDDPSSPIRKALNSTESGGVIKAFKGKDKSGIEALAQYDPDLAQRINTTRGYAAEANSIRPSTAQPKAMPILPPKPATAAPEITKVGPEDIQSAKGEALAKRANKIRTTGHGLANTLAVLDTVRNLVHGNLAGIGTDIAARGGLSLAQHGLAFALERPGVVEFLTKPTAADIAELAKLPAEQRTAAAQNLQPLLDAATARGLKVAPAIAALTAGGATLPAGHPLAQAPAQ